MGGENPLAQAGEMAATAAGVPEAAPAIEAVSKTIEEYNPQEIVTSLSNSILEDKFKIKKAELAQAQKQGGAGTGEGYESVKEAYELIFKDPTFTKNFTKAELIEIKGVLDNASFAAKGISTAQARLITGTNEANRQAGIGGQTGSAVGGVIGGATGLVATGAGLAAFGGTFTAGVGAMATISSVGAGLTAVLSMIPGPGWVGALVVGGVTLAATAIGATIGSQGIRNIAATIGGVRGWDMGAGESDELVEKPIFEKEQLKAFEKFYQALEQRNPELFKKIELVTNLVQNEQNVLNVLKKSAATPDEKNNVAKAFIMDAMRFEATNAMSKFGITLNTDYAKTMAQMSDGEAYSYLKQIVAEGAKSPDGKPIQISRADFKKMFNAMRGYGAALLNGDEDIGWIQMFEKYHDAKVDGKTDRLSDITDQLTSRIHTGSKGIMSMIKAAIDRAFQGAFHPQSKGKVVIVEVDSHDALEHQKAVENGTVGGNMAAAKEAVDGLPIPSALRGALPVSGNGSPTPAGNNHLTPALALK